MNNSITQKKRIKKIFLSGLCLVLPGILAFLISSCATADKGNQKEQAVNKRNIGEANILQGNFTAALRELLEAEKFNPQDPITQNYLGIAYKGKQMPDLAIVHFKKAVELNSGYSQARNNLGTAYLDHGDWDLAISCFKEVLEDALYTTPQYPLANIGRAYFYKQDYNLAETFYKKALEKQPNLLIALNGLGETAMATGKYGQAIDIYQKAVHHDPRSGYFYFQLARSYEHNGDFRNAAESYQKVIDISPDNVLVKDARDAKRRLFP